LLELTVIVSWIVALADTVMVTRTVTGVPPVVVSVTLTV
jgi:hypothetical protein